MRKPDELYRGKYIIVLYENDDETLVTTYDNLVQFAEAFSITRNHAKTALYDVFRGVKKKFKKYLIYLVSDDGDDDV